MGGKRGRAEADGDERRAQLDEDTGADGEHNGMTGRGARRDETLSEKRAVLTSSNHKRERERQGGGRRRRTIKPQRCGAGHIGRGTCLAVFKELPRQVFKRFPRQVFKRLTRRVFRQD